MFADNDTETDGEMSGDELSADIGETRIPVQNLPIYRKNKRSEAGGFRTEFVVSVSYARYDFQ